MASQKEWLKFRAVYLKQRGKNHEGYYECDCGHWSKYPEVHHSVKRSTAPERVLDETNLQLLCTGCHDAKHDNSSGPQPKLLGDSDYDPDDIINYL